MTQGQTSRNRRLARTGVPTFFCDLPASTEVSQQMSRKDSLPTFISLVHLLSLWFGYCTSFLSFTLPFCKLTEENSRKQRGLATDVSQGQTSTDVSQGQTSRNRRLARTGMPTSLFSSYFSYVLVHLPSL